MNKKKQILKKLSTVIKNFFHAVSHKFTDDKWIAQSL